MTWSIDSIQKWVTLIAAVLAAIGSFLNLRGKRDKIKVGYGPLHPPLDSKEYVHVVSLSDHPIDIIDYGFVMQRGQLLSLPDRLAHDPYDGECFIDGSRKLESRNEAFEGSIALMGMGLPVGAYARTNSQTRPTIDFRWDMPWWKRLWFRFIWWRRLSA